MVSASLDIFEAPGRTQLEARYRQVLAGPAEWNDTLDTLLSHRSVRAYLPDALPEGTLDLIVAAAQSAATSSNLQPWSVLAVQDPARKARLAALAGNQQQIIDAPLFLVWLIDLHRLEQIGADQGTPAQAVRYLETFLLGAVDTSLAAQNAVVALESIGLGSVYIGGIRNKPAQVAAELGLPPQVFALFGLAVGHPDPARPAAVKPRLQQVSVLHHERYADAGNAPIADYNARFRTFQQDEGLPERDWTQVVAQRLRGPEVLHGREDLRAILHGLGFGLE